MVAGCCCRRSHSRIERNRCFFAAYGATLNVFHLMVYITKKCMRCVSYFFLCCHISPTYCFIEKKMKCCGYWIFSFHFKKNFSYYVGIKFCFIFSSFFISLCTASYFSRFFWLIFSGAEYYLVVYEWMRILHKLLAHIFWAEALLLNHILIVNGLQQQLKQPASDCYENQLGILRKSLWYESLIISSLRQKQQTTK